MANQEVGETTINIEQGVLAPQEPLKKGNSFLYPLTTTNQVLRQGDNGIQTLEDYFKELKGSLNSSLGGFISSNGGQVNDRGSVFRNREGSTFNNSEGVAFIKALKRSPTEQNDFDFYPILSMQCPSGTWSIGTDKQDNLVFSFDKIGGSTVETILSPEGVFTANKTFNAVWNDYAEYFLRGEKTSVGDIIALSEDGETYKKATNKSSVIIGVQSDIFGQILGGEFPPKGENFEDYNIERYIPVGLKGRVPCKILGRIKKGDFIIPSGTPGVGKRLKFKWLKSFYHVIGVAIEDKKDLKIGIIKIFI